MSKLAPKRVLYRVKWSLSVKIREGDTLTHAITKRPYVILVGTVLRFRYLVIGAGRRAVDLLGECKGPAISLVPPLACDPTW